MNVGIVISLLPVVVIASIIYKRDSDGESSAMLRKLLLFGVLSAFLTLFLFFSFRGISTLFNADESLLNRSDLFVYVFVTIALVEEFSKAIFVYLVAWRHKEFDQTFDAIVYSVFVSLGFAALENIIYVFADSATMFQTATMRAITAVPCHAICGIFMGYLIAKAKLNHHQNNNLKMYWYVLLSLLIPALVHAIYDWVLFARFPIIYFIGLVIAMFVIGFGLMYRESKNNKRIIN